MNDDAEIIAEFLVESHENLDQLDRDLVALEQSPGSRELLSSIFRAIHTIKGTSGFLALNRLESLTHAGESLLSRLRDGDLVMDESTTGVLLQMVDATRALLEVVERTGTDLGDGPDIVPIVEAVDALLVDPVVDPVGHPVADPVGEQPAPASRGAGRTPEVRLGEVMVTRGEVTPADVGEAVAEQLRGDTRPLGEILVALGSTEPEAVDAALADQSGDVSEGEVGPRRASVVDSSVRVDVDLLDSLVQLVGELVLTRNQILQKLDGVEDLDLVRAAQRLNLVASELQEGVMKTRMQPIGQVWAKMPRVVRDLGHQLGRKVSLEMEGHDTELDRSLLEALKGPLTHLVRNALDHGLEPPAERAARGKAEEGRLMLRAFHESGQVVVEISDDGRGIDTDRVAAVAVKRGVVTQEQVRSMEPRELQGLIFSPGFSTAAEITNVSGRGVGMDVVRTNIEGIGGTVDLTSAPGCGTTVRVRIPLTLAIIPALLVGEGDDIYAVPQANLVELVRIEGEERDQALHDLAGAPVLRLRGRLLPLVFLADTLGRPDHEADALTVVVLQADEVRFGLVVSDVHDTQEIVVKPIGRQLKALATYAGATIMGDGRVALILDVGGIAALCGIEPVERSAEADAHADSAAEQAGRSTLLLLEASPGHRAALPLGSISRLEEFSVDAVERTGTTEVVQYRDGILPLVRLDAALGLAGSASISGHMSVVVHEEDGRRVGIVIERVLEVVETVVAGSEIGRRPGVLGSAVVQEHVTDLVDLDAVVALAGVGA